MPSKIMRFVATACVIASLNSGSAFAGWSERRNAFVAYPDPSLYAPYYYSRWSPYSAYSIYDHLSGGRQLCSMPSEPCDNNHRIQN